MTIQGILHVKGETQVISDKFSKRELVIKTEENYPQLISCQLIKDKCDLLNLYNVGDKIDVSINLKGREWTSPKGEIKYFNTIEVWRFNDVEQSAKPTGIEKNFIEDALQHEQNEREEDLPF